MPNKNISSQKQTEENIEVGSQLKEKIRMLIFITILGVVSAGILVGLSNYTEPIVAKNKEMRLKKGVLEAFNINFTEKNVDRVFQQNIKVIEKNNLTIYLNQKGSLAFKFGGNALWGPVSGVIALSSDLGTMEGLFIIEEQETPGLGGRITEEEFLQQFQGLKISPKIKILPAREKAEAENEVDGISGATLTSKALERLLNEKISQIQQKLREGNLRG